jgi:hypothetical protein
MHDRTSDSQAQILRRGHVVASGGMLSEAASEVAAA